ncbi:MAG: MarR family transcriptional regulator [Acholeplasmataceae bacterium]
MIKQEFNLKLTAVLLRATNEVQRVLKKDIGTHKLNLTEFGVIEFLYHNNEQPIQGICSKLLMANSSMTYVIDGLEKKHFVKRNLSEEDKRITKVGLTEEGKQYFQTVFPVYAKSLSDLYLSLTESEMDLLIGLLGKIESEIKRK